MTERWKAVSTRPEEGKEVIRLWHVETDEKDKKQVFRLLESMYNTNQRKLLPMGYKSASSSMLKTLLGSMEWIKHKSSLIYKLMLSRFVDMFEFQVLKGCIMRIK
jgi:hypothetical protein